ncbi:MAG: biotin transporter BioY [Chloroflexi bacterium]|nr:biotin transporter BioY [Chloroflexota bacterium]
MAYITYADALRPAAQRSARLYDAQLVLAGSLLVALSAQIAIRLPFSPVPITGQTLAVLLVGALLGSRRGGLALLAYLAEGAAGLPVFAGGASGPTYMTGPTGGYLIGFVLAAALTGALAERGWDRRVWTTALAMLLGNVAIYVCGVIWLSTFVGFARALDVGLVPFLAGDTLKIALSAALLPSGWVLLGTRTYHR